MQQLLVQFQGKMVEKEREGKELPQGTQSKTTEVKTDIHQVAVP